MEIFEKRTVAMVGGPCSQRVTGNTSWLNQPQSAIIEDIFENTCSFLCYQVQGRYAFKVSVNYCEFFD